MRPLPYCDPASPTDEIAARRQLAGQLPASLEHIAALEAEFRQTFEHAAVGIAHIAADGSWLRANQHLCDIVGYSRDELLATSCRDITHPDDRIADLARRRRTLAGEAPAGGYEKRCLRQDGGIVWVKFTLSVTRPADGAPRHLIAVVEDITAHKAAEMQMRLAAKVFDRAGEAIVITDADGRIVTVNDAFTRITGYALAEAAGKTPALLKSGRHPPEFYRSLWNRLATDGWWHGEIWNRNKAGEIYPEWLTITCVCDDDGRVSNYVATFSDITAIKNSQHKLEYLASHDDLTALSNRTAFQERLRQAIAQARRQKHALAVLFIDLDNFKTINDTLGHDVGDLLLKEAAQRLLACLRDADTVARLGGDEFAAVLYNADALAVGTACQRVIEALGAAFSIDGTDRFLTASVGVSLFPDDGDDGGTLLKNADAAMYRAKEQGKSQFQCFTADLKLAAQRRLALETGLRQALLQNRLRLNYQPKVRIADGALIGAEALIRWTDPDLGVVSPAEFIAVAEKAGLIGGIGRFVVNRAIADIVAWRAAGLATPPIALNISPSQLRDESFAAWLCDRLGAAALPTSSIVVELTEGALMERGEAGLQVLDGLDRRGIRISIDDFGTGYSSLSYLKRMPIAELKIDRSFVDGIADDADDRAIAAAILSLAHTLGIAAVAEGVETAEQLTVLRLLDCEFAQGYLFHRPMGAEQFRALLRPPPTPGTLAASAALAAVA